MIWIISSPESIYGEADILMSLLAAGAHRIILRKPNWHTAQYKTLLDNIAPACYAQLLIRDQPQLATDYQLAGVHWSGHTKEQAVTTPFRENSTGIHHATDISQMDTRFNTWLLSPVFDSISKPGYTGKFAAEAITAMPWPQQGQILALGGVDHNNIHLIKQWRFHGAALLGAIWRTPEKAVESYQHIQSLWNRNDPT
ncbi:thiamine phosphate synthase [Chitinophaga sp. 30R24]